MVNRNLIRGLDQDQAEWEDELALALGGGPLGQIDYLAEVLANVRNRNLQVDVAALLDADAEARAARGELEAVRRRRNEISTRMKG